MNETHALTLQKKVTFGQCAPYKEKIRQCEEYKKYRGSVLLWRIYGSNIVLWWGNKTYAKSYYKIEVFYFSM